MLDQKIIRHSDSPWSSPIWVVPKKLDATGKQKWRVVIDYNNNNNKFVYLANSYIQKTQNSKYRYTILNIFKMRTYLQCVRVDGL